MERLMIIMATATLLVMCASPSEAWKVSITNSCFAEVEIFVNGQHLFYDDKVDCKVKVQSGKTGTCEMPVGICSSKIHGRYYVRDVFGRTYEQQLSPLDCCNTGGFSNSPTCCWDVYVEVTQPLAECRLERR